jgi:hypothetical protein
MKRQQRKGHGGKALQIGIGWYTYEQWLRLIEVSADREKLDDSFAEWERNAASAVAALQSQGHSAHKIMVDVDQLVNWCQQRGRPVDAGARAEYVADVCRTTA